MKIDYEQQSNAEDHYTPSKVWKGAVGVTPPNIEYRPDCIYSHYDTHGNPRQVVDKNGKTTCYFWGYNGRHIVAKIEIRLTIFCSDMVSELPIPKRCLRMSRLSCEMTRRKILSLRPILTNHW